MNKWISILKGFETIPYTVCAIIATSRINIAAPLNVPLKYQFGVNLTLWTAISGLILRLIYFGICHCYNVQHFKIDVVFSETKNVIEDPVRVKWKSDVFSLFIYISAKGRSKLLNNYVLDLRLPSGVVFPEKSFSEIKKQNENISIDKFKCIFILEDFFDTERKVLNEDGKQIKLTMIKTNKTPKISDIEINLRKKRSFSWIYAFVNKLLKNKQIDLFKTKKWNGLNQKNKVNF